MWSLSKYAAVAAAFCLVAHAAPPAAPAQDPLGRENPRSTVTNFLKVCHQNDYAKAAQYLDLSAVPAKQRSQEGVQLAKDLESLLNSAPSFDVLQVSQNPEGNLDDDANPAIEHVAQVTGNGEKYTLELQRFQPASAPAYWQFSSATVGELPKLAPVPSTESVIEAHLPRFLVSVQPLDTPLWKWLALLIGAAILFGMFRILVGLVRLAMRQRQNRWPWLHAVVDPILAVLAVLIFRIFEEIVLPSALARVYLGRTLLLIVVASVAWGVINLVDYLLARLGVTMDPRKRVVSRSVLYLFRRVSKVLIAVFAAILILDNWGFNMTTIIAGLGVGGIAVALAAQQTIANVFGGVSVISDAPVMIGDFGNFGGVIGTVEEIGMRSSRIRTLTRTIVSIPNSSFAGMNLENYAVRDKILFNPTFQIKRSTPPDQVRRFLESLRKMLAEQKEVQVGPAPVRISGYATAGYTIEVFAYVLTPDIDEFYVHQADLFLAIEQVVASNGIELA